MNRKQVDLKECKQCGMIEEVTKGAILKMCWRCAMVAADKVRDNETKMSNEYDWRKTITAIKKKYKLGKESTVAFALKISPQMLSMIKKEKRPIPIDALKIIKEKYAECVSFKINELQAKN